jgi:dTDP-4-dehydrorhamnose 3,5-epimerase
LSKTAIFQYKVDNYYNKESERGIIWNDKELEINWEIKKEEILLAEKDSLLPSLTETTKFD